MLGGPLSLLSALAECPATALSHRSCVLQKWANPDAPVRALIFAVRLEQASESRGGAQRRWPAARHLPREGEPRRVDRPLLLPTRADAAGDLLRAHAVARVVIGDVAPHEGEPRVRIVARAFARCLPVEHSK